MNELVVALFAGVVKGIPGLVFFLVSSALALRDFEPPAPTRVSRNDPVEGWLTVRLNHFKASNNDTFRMRYYYNDEFADRGNIVIFVGGEWAIHPGWTQGGLAYELAEITGAGIFYTEHRYYGNTRPSADTNVEDLRFLSVDQALGDLAQFIQHVKSDNFEEGRYKNGAVALVGCSYAGSMATWMKLGYPHLVDAAFSDSGPLHAQEDFPEYLEVITEALRSQGSEACLTSVEQAVEELVALLNTTDGANTVSTLFNTCSQIQASSPLDVATFFWYGVTETFAYLIQYATPGDIPAACAVLTNETVADPAQRLANWVTAQSWTQPCIETRYSVVVEQHTNTSYDAPHTCSQIQASSPLDVATFFWYGVTETFAYLIQYATPGDIPAACAVLTNETVADPAQRLANWVTAQSWTQPCIETRYSVVVEQHTNTSYDAPQSVMRLWTYQTCVEYGWYQTTTSGRQPFLDTIPLEYFHQMCRDFFTTYFDENLLRAGIYRSNLMFAGLTHLPDHVVSVAGGHDPWAPMGPNVTHATEKAPVYVVPTVSHCRAIQSTASSETEELAAAKQAVLDHMVDWMGAERSAARAPFLSSVGLMAVVVGLLLK